MTSGTNFVDKIRAGRVTTHHTRQIYVAAFDPDLDTTGFASVLGRVVMGKYVHESHVLREIGYKNKKSYSSARRTWLMAEQIARFSFDAMSGAQNYIVIEAQEVYKNGKADANDLLRLAQITGQLQGRFAQRSCCEMEIVLPKVWKQNKQKEGMHARAVEEVALVGDYSSHAMDALCMALWKAQSLARSGMMEVARLTSKL